MAANKPRCAEMRSWAQESVGKHCLAPLNGTTGRALSAYIHLLDAWMSGRGVRVEEALRATVAILQRSEWRLAAELIIGCGDYGFVEELWPKIKPAEAPEYVVRDWKLVEVRRGEGASCSSS